MGRPALMRSAVVILQARNIMKWHDIGLEYGLCHLHYWGLIQAYLTMEVCQQPEHICICWSNKKKRNFESFGNWKTDIPSNSCWSLRVRKLHQEWRSSTKDVKFSIVGHIQSTLILSGADQWNLIINEKKSYRKDSGSSSLRPSCNYKFRI